MNASASGRLAALLCLAAAITVPVVVAQPAPSVQAEPIGVELSYEAFAGCPEREAFAKNLAARQRGAVTSAVQLDISLRDLADGGGTELSKRVEGSIAVRSANGLRSARRIVASTCGEAADALALIAALALQGIEVEEVPADKDPSDSRVARRKPRTSDPPPREAVSETEPAATETATAAATASKPDNAVVAEREVVDEVPSDAEPIEPNAARTTRAYVQLSGGVASGVLPRVQPFPELSLGLEQGAPGALIWSVRAAFRISPDQRRHFEQGVVTFGWWTGLSAVCLGARSSRLSASGCATLEVGLLSASASETENRRSAQRAWVALGPGLTVGYDVAPALRLSLGAELLTPLARYRLELPRGTAVHEPSALGLRAGLGAMLWLE